MASTCAASAGAFALMGSRVSAANAAGVLLSAHAMILAAYLIREAAHRTLFAAPRANALAGEAMNFVAGASYAPFERIRHMHIRHLVDRADLVCFDFKALLRYLLAVVIQLHVLNFFDAFHHTLEQYFVGDDEPLPMAGPGPPLRAEDHPADPARCAARPGA